MAALSTANTPQQNSDAFQAALDSAKADNKSVLLPGGDFNYAGGVYLARSIDIKGAGQRATRLNNVSVSTPGITIKSPRLPDINYLIGTMEITDLQLSGTSTGAAIEYDTMANIELRNVTILDCAGVGIYMARTSHVATITLSHCKIQHCATGIYGKNVADRQINAVNIVGGSEISQNYGNGVDIWASVLNIKDCCIQGNAGVGINIESSGSDSTSVSTISIEGNYFETNYGGSLRVTTGGYVGGAVALINNLRIVGNYVSEGVGTTPPANRSVSFSCRGDGSTPSYTYLNMGVQTGIWSENHIPIYANNDNYIDFGNSLSDLFVVRAESSGTVQSAAAGSWSQDYTKFVNLGKARFECWANRVIHGKAFAESASLIYGISGISSTFTSSASDVTVEYAIPTKTGDILMNAAIPIYFDDITASVDVTIDFRRVSTTNPALSASIGANTVTNVSHNSTSVPKLVRSQYLEQIQSDMDAYRAGSSKEEFHIIIKIKMSAGSKAATYRLGNLIVRMN